MRFFTDTLPPKARYYLLTVLAAGGVVVLSSIQAASASSEMTWMYFLPAVLLGSILPVRTARSETSWTTVTICLVFIFLAMALYSLRVAVILAAIDGLLSGLVAFSAARLLRSFFNASRAVLATLASGLILYPAAGAPAPLIRNAPGAWRIVAAVAIAAVVYILVSSALSLTAARLASGALRLREMGYVAPANLGAGLAASLILVSFGASQLLIVVAAIPLLLLGYALHVFSKERAAVLRREVEDLRELHLTTIGSLAMAIDAKDQCTHGHVYRVQALSLQMAELAGMKNQSELSALRTAALLHDVGKLAIPEYVLNKPAPLTEGEMLKMRAHPSVGADILQTIPFEGPVVPFVRHHHERWDGSGYPAGLKGSAIPLGARILALADSYDALRSDRPYRAKLTRELAADYIRSERGKAFDPALVDLFLVKQQLLEEASRKADDAVPRIPQEHWEKQPGEEDRRQARSVFHSIASAHREVQAVYEISEVVGRSLNTTETMRILGEKLGELAPHDACVIFLSGEREGRLRVAHATGAHEDQLRQLDVRLGQGVTGWVAANNQALTNVGPAPDFLSSPQLEVHFKSCLSFPLSLEDRVVGVITLYASRPEAFSQEVVRLIDSVASHAAAAINNAVVFEATQEDAYTDLLTGLPNLRYFNLIIEQELRRANRIGYPITLLMMDLDNFKTINDGSGHQAGDHVLMEVGRVLRSHVRRSDSVVRYAGDEFLAILPGTPKDQARQTIERIQGSVDTLSVTVGDKSVRIGISVGVAAFPDDGQDIDALLKKADADMYANKNRRSSRPGAAGDVVPFEKR